MNTKEKILEILNTKDFVSGENIAKKCGISRAAINKAINSLRNDGYFIEAITNKGYKILSEADKIDSEIIRNLIEENGEKINFVYAFDSIDSTNTEAKRKCATIGAFRNQNGELTEGGKSLHKTIFVSSEQTAGRGRLGRVFSSPKNSGVYFSLIFSPKNGVTNPALLTAAAAVAVTQTLDELYNLDSETKIKWVNDIFLSDSQGNFKKVCGILTEGIANFENRTIESAIVGIGINVRNGGFKGELSKIAGSVEDILNFSSENKKISRNKIVANVISKLLKFYNKMENLSENNDSEHSLKSMIDFYRKKSFLIGKTVQVNPVAGLQGETYKATVIDISDSAELVVKTEDGEKKALNSGEVSLHSYDFLQ